MSTKRGKWERKSAHRIDPNQPPPSPEETTALAASGVQINRGNSDKIPLTPAGVEQVQDTAEKLARKGGLDSLKTSGSLRGEQTAHTVAAANPSPLEPQPDGDLTSWAQGNLEGQPKALVKDQIRDLIRKNPSQKIPGQGAMSTRPGESFDDFRSSRLSAIRGAMQELAQNPNAKIGRTTHSQVIKLVKGWIANGTPDDFSVKPEAMEEEKEAPSSVTHLFPGKEGDWQVSEVNLDDQKPLGPGIYLIRHGVTPWNKENYDKANAGQDALTQIAKYTKSLDFGRVRATAKRATDAGHLNDDQVGQAIDSALPDPDDAADLPTHHLLAVASAASPEKSKNYTPALRQHFAAVASLPPDARDQLMNHLRMIGLDQAV